MPIRLALPGVFSRIEGMVDGTKISMANGSDKTSEELLPLVYGELRSLAAYKMGKEAPGQTLQATALVHEAWIRLSKQENARWLNREQFYAVAAEVMRRILVDRARRRAASKHGGELERVELQAVEVPCANDDELTLRVHDALEKLAKEHPQKAEIVKLRFFVGLDNAETASLLNISEKTVQRHWAFSKAWLARTIEE